MVMRNTRKIITLIFLLATNTAFADILNIEEANQRLDDMVDGIDRFSGSAASIEIGGCESMSHLLEDQNFVSAIKNYMTANSIAAGEKDSKRRSTYAVEKCSNLLVVSVWSYEQTPEFAFYAANGSRVIFRVHHALSELKLGRPLSGGAEFPLQWDDLIVAQ